MMALSLAYESGGSGRYASPTLPDEDDSLYDLRLRQELLHALARGQFRLVYQPIYSLDGGVLQRAEALLRWSHPRLGEVAPDRFVPLLEEMQLIGRVGDWVLRQACIQAKKWHAVIDDAASRVFRVAVNVSVLQLEAETFETRLLQIMGETGCDPRWIELEITESVLIADLPSMSTLLQRLGKHGITVAIDDFGAGYASLNHLAALPVQSIKLDRALVAKLPGAQKEAAIVRAMGALARALDITMTIEGIERSEQKDFFLRDVDVQGQGFLLGAPMSGAELLARLLGGVDAVVDSVALPA